MARRCFSINLMIKDKSSGYGWGNGIMYIKGNPGVKIFYVKNKMCGMKKIHGLISQIACKPYHSQWTIRMAG